MNKTVLKKLSILLTALIAAASIASCKIHDPPDQSGLSSQSSSSTEAPSDDASSSDEASSTDDSSNSNDETPVRPSRYEDGVQLDGYGLRFKKLPDREAYALYAHWGTPKDVEIPAYFNGLPVAQIGCQLDDVQYLPFKNCEALVSVLIPATVERIYNNYQRGGHAFEGCENLASISMQNAATQFPFDMFTETAFWKNYDGDVIYIGDMVAGFKNSPTEVTIREGVTHLHADAFRGCTSLESVTLPQTVVEVEARAFMGCTSLSEVTMSENIEEIGDGAFRDCTALTELDKPESLKKLGSRVFENSGYWKGHEGDVVYWKEWCVGYKNAPTELSVRAGTEYITDYAFYDCATLNSVTLPESVNEIGRYAFAYNSALKSFDFSSGVKALGDYAFYSCSSLEAALLPDGLTDLGKAAFEGCKRLSEVTLPDNLTQLGDRAFYGCSLLSYIELPNTLQAIGNYTFKNCKKLNNITLPNKLERLGRGAFSGCSTLYFLQFPKTATAIEPYTFENCTNLSAVALGEGIRSIGAYAFKGCVTLTNITLPDNVKTIDRFAFYGCKRLEKVLIHSFLTIEGYTFRICDHASCTEESCRDELVKVKYPEDDEEE